YQPYGLSVRFNYFCIANMETNMVAVERVREYSEVTPEADWHSAATDKPASDWPTEGCVEFRNYSAAYRPDLDLALKDLSVHIIGGEKVGIGKNNVLCI